jgi:hypothetical protein
MEDRLEKWAEQLREEMQHGIERCLAGLPPLTPGDESILTFLYATLRSMGERSAEDFPEGMPSPRDAAEAVALALAGSTVAEADRWIAWTPGTKELPREISVRQPVLLACVLSPAEMLASHLGGGRMKEGEARSLRVGVFVEVAGELVLHGADETTVRFIRSISPPPGASLSSSSSCAPPPPSDRPDRKKDPRHGDS